MSFYTRYILSPLIDCCCGCKLMAAQRAKLVPQATGVVLELGAGSGHNFTFYDPKRVTSIRALEPEPALAERARKAARDCAIPIEIIEETAENMSVAENSIDTVLVTYALCTIPNVIAALTAARRTLKPGGQLLFCEHGLDASDTRVSRTQARLEPYWKRVFGGCHLTRDIPALITGSGFGIDQMDAGFLTEGPRFASYQYIGHATPTA